MINWQQMLENTVPTKKVKQRGSRFKMSVGEANTQMVVSVKNSNGLTRGRLASHKVRFFPVPSRYALKEAPKTITIFLRLGFLYFNFLKI